MYSGTSASYRYGRTIRGHYPYVVTRQLIWTARQGGPRRPLPPARAEAPVVEDLAPALDDNHQPGQLRADACLPHDAVYGAGRSPLGTRPVSGKDEPSGSPELAAMSYRLRSRPPATGGSAPVRFQSGNSRYFAVNAGHRRHPLARQKRPICSDIACRTKSRVLLAMQKVEGSNPFSRSPVVTRGDALMGTLRDGKGRSVHRRCHSPLRLESRSAQSSLSAVSLSASPDCFHA